MDDTQKSSKTSGRPKIHVQGECHKRYMSLARKVRQAERLAVRLSVLLEDLRIELAEAIRETGDRKRTRRLHDGTACAQAITRCADDDKNNGKKDGKKIDVDIDGRVLSLSSTLADLLFVLADDSGECAGDGLVGWKPEAEVRRLIRRDSRESLSRKALNQRIHILRNQLENGGLPSGLVQTSRGRGARFAVKRTPPSSVTESEAQ